MTRIGGSPVARQSTRVALWATGLVALFYVAVAIAVVVWLTVSLTSQLDERLERALVMVSAPQSRPEPPAADAMPAGLAPGAGNVAPPDLPFGRERAFWFISTDGVVTAIRDDLPLPTRYHGVAAPITIDIEGSEVRIAGTTVTDGRVVLGESMDPVNDARTTVILGLLAIAPVLLLAVFLGSLTVGRRVAMPIERARQRQLAFTADASHELRTPLSVIEANASLALAAERDTTWYRHAFQRVQAESQRMRRLIEELLWLARFDAQQRPAGDEPVDVGVIVAQAADRFAAPAEARGLSLEVRHEAGAVTLSAPPEWIDQLVGVLLDNACRYAPPGGRVQVSVAVSERRSVLSVEDSGPGIPTAERERIFDRFHRASDEPGGAGLGLAIADAIVQATGGRWHTGTSPLGGAQMSVSWPLAGGRESA